MRKPSNISPRNAQDWRPTLFLDQTQSAELLADLLRAARWRVILHSAQFPGSSNLKDHLWIPAATAAINDCAIISSDKSMRLWQEEGGLVRPAIERCNAKVFFLSGTSRAEKRSLEEQSYAIIRAQREICRLYRRHAHTYVIARIHLGGRVGEVQLLHTGGRRRRQHAADVA